MDDTTTTVDPQQLDGDAQPLIDMDPADAEAATFVRDLGFFDRATDPVELDFQIDRAIERLRDVEAEAQHNALLAARRLDEVRRWLDEANDTLKRRAFYLRSAIEALAEGYPYRGKKSRKLPAGTFGTRMTQDRVEITDKAAALKFSKANGVPVKEEATVTALKQYAQANGDLGDPAHGWKLVPGDDAFFVTPNKAEG